MAKKADKEKKVEEVNSLKTQFKVLTRLYDLHIQSQVRFVDIFKLVDGTTIRDEKDLMRALFILEGHKLVSPNPAGDFTSKFWGITPTGISLIKNSTGTRIAA